MSGVPKWAVTMDARRFTDEKVAASLDRPIGKEKPYLVARAGWTSTGESVSTSDAAYFRALDVLRSELAKIPRDESADAPGWDGFYRGSLNFDAFERVGSLMGFPARPVPQPPNDARAFRVSRGLRPMGKTELDVARTVARVLLPHQVRAASIYIDKVASGGFPGRLKGVDRLQAAQRPFAEAQAAVPALFSGDLEAYYKRFGHVHVSSPVYRDQAERRGKVRIAQDFSGRSVETNPDLDGSVPGAPDYAYACRRRLANAVPDACIDEALLADEWKDHVDTVAGFTAVNRTPEQIMAKAVAATGCTDDESSPLCFDPYDIDNCDQTIDPAMVAVWVDVMEPRVGPAWASRFLMSIRLPALYRQTEPGRSGYYLSGDPFSLAGFRTWYVNPSGHRATTQVAQLAGITYGVIALVNAGLCPPDEASIAGLLQGTRSGVCFFNAGDNLLFATKGTATRARVKEAMLHLGFVGASESETFLGQCPAIVSGKKRMVANLATSVYNLFMPSRSVADEREGDALVGAGPRDVHYSTNPTYVSSVRNVIAKAMVAMGVTSYPAAMNVRRAAVTAADGETFDVAALLAANFDAVYYKVRKQDIPPEWLDRFFLRILPADTARWVAEIGRLEKRVASRALATLMSN